MTLRPLLLAALLVALASSAGAQAPLQIRLDPQIPVVGLSAEVTAQFFETLPESASLFVRAVGETAYQEFVGVDQGDAFWTVVIDEIPPSGLEVYASYVLDGETFTEPLQNPEAFPFRVPVLVPAITSAVDLPRRQYRMVSVPFVLGANSGLPAVLGSDAPIDVFGDDFGQMNDTADRVAAILRKTAGAQDVKVEQTEGLPMLDIAFNRDAAAALGRVRSGASSRVPTSSRVIKPCASTSAGGR